jgi:hypothetical protein
MLPSVAYQEFYTRNDFLVTDELLREGFGYWLLWHRRHLSAAELTAYQREVRERFQKIDLKEKLKRFDVRVIQATHRVHPDLPVAHMRQAKNSRIYFIDL